MIARSTMTLPVFLVLVLGCGGDGDVVQPPENVSFANDIQPVFTMNCLSLGCHIDPNPQLGMDLSNGESYTNIVGVQAVQLGTMQRINPQDPSTSYLFQKVSDTHLSIGGSGNRMPPPPREALDADDLELLRVWIEEGASNN